MSREDRRRRARFERAIEEARARVEALRHPQVLRAPSPKLPGRRERDLLQLLALGHTQVQAARLLGIHRGSVQRMMVRMSKKAGVHGEAQLMDVAFEEGWIDLPFDD